MKEYGILNPLALWG